MTRPPFVLVPHPGSPDAVTVTAGADRTLDRLALRYRIEAGPDADPLVLPAPAVPARTDGLWRTTCLEAFVRLGGGDGYIELNMSPSTAWAAYFFDGYRSGMRPAADIGPPDIETTRDAHGLTLSAVWDLSRLTSAHPRAPWSLGLSAVVEHGAGLSYMALAHPAGAPDFHHAAGFALDLPPPG